VPTIPDAAFRQTERQTEVRVAEVLKWTEDSEPELREALARPWWKLRFNGELERRFDERVAPIQAKDARNNYFLAMFFCNVFAIADYRFLPDVYLIAWVLRFAVITPMFMITIWAEFYARQSFRRGWATLVLMLVTTAALTYPLLISNSHDLVHYHVGVIVVVLFSNLLTDLRFALALVGSVVFMIMYMLELTVGLDLPSHLVGNYGMVSMSVVALSLVASYRRERHLRTVFVMLALLDIAEQRQTEANARLRTLAAQDPLTGLANRRRFDEEYPRLWKEAIRQSQPMSVLFIDLDRFKAYNDTYGHSSGDDILERLADVLREKATRRPLDLAVRNGGEEFLVVLPDTTIDVAVAIAQRLVDALSALAIPHERSSYGVVTASVGVAGGLPRAEQSPQDFVEQADAAMYKAKENGRNRVESIAL